MSRGDRDPNRGNRRVPLSTVSAADLLGLNDDEPFPRPPAPPLTPAEQATWERFEAAPVLAEAWEWSRCGVDGCDQRGTEHVDVAEAWYLMCAGHAAALGAAPMTAAPEPTVEMDPFAVGTRVDVFPVPGGYVVAATGSLDEDAAQALADAARPVIEEQP